MRRRMLASLGGGWKNPYVTDGLVAMWDGEWNAGWGVHDPNATVWKNLIGSNDLTLGTNGSWSSLALECSNGNKFAATGHFPISFAHFEICIRCDSLYTDSINRVVASFNTGMDCGLSLERNNGLLFHGGYESWAFNFGNKKISISKPYDYNINPIVNGVELLSRGGSDTWVAFENFVYIGNYTTGSRPFLGGVFSIRIYNHILVQQEIAANYAVDKARFNLP